MLSRYFGLVKALHRQVHALSTTNSPILYDDASKACTEGGMARNTSFDWNRFFASRQLDISLDNMRSKLSFMPDVVIYHPKVGWIKYTLLAL